MPTQAELSERAAAGLRAHWRTQCGYVAGGEVAEHDGLLATATNLPDQTLNVAFAPGPVTRPEQALDWFVAWFQARGLRPGIELAAGHDLEPLLAERGFTVVVRRSAMTLHPISVDAIDGVTVDVVETADDLAAFQRIQGEVFDMTPDVVTEFLPARAQDEPGIVFLLARDGDTPCATAAVSVSEHGAGIVGVATLEPLRRKGFGRAVTAAAVRAGADLGADLAWLYPSAMARPLYTGLGFVTLDDVQVWVAPR